MFTWIFQDFNLCPLPLMWTQGTTQKCVAQSSLLPPLRYLFIYIGKFLPELSLPQAEQSRPSASPLCEVVKPFSHLCGPSQGLSPWCPSLSGTGEPGVGTALQLWSHQWVKHRITPSACWTCPAWHGPEGWWLLCYTAALWLMVSLMFTRIPKSSSAKLPSSQSAPGMCCFMGLLLPS